MLARLSLQVKGRGFKTSPVFTTPDFKHPDLPRFTNNNCNLRGKAYPSRILSNLKIQTITYILVMLLGIVLRTFSIRFTKEGICASGGNFKHFRIYTFGWFYSDSLGFL